MQTEKESNFQLYADTLCSFQAPEKSAQVDDACVYTENAATVFISKSM